MKDKKSTRRPLSKIVSCCSAPSRLFNLDGADKESPLTKSEKIRSAVREGYARVALSGISCCGAGYHPQETGRKMGYTDDEMNAVPEGANLGLGCGNPLAIASLREGETVLDLGSGAGFDCFLAAAQLGVAGRVIGVDMTPEMIEAARKNARKGLYKNVEFRQGEIENLPVEDSSIDVIISNCVINLSPDKDRVFKEAFRVLKPLGRLMVSDIVLLKDLPEDIRNSLEAYVGCVAGAVLKESYLRAIENAGFSDVRVLKETTFPVEFLSNDPTVQAIAEHTETTREKLNFLAGSISSISVYAKKV